MSLSNTSDAIGAVTALIHNELIGADLTVDVGFPRSDPPPQSFFLILYEIVFDSSLRNVPLDRIQPPPIWLVLKYILISYDVANKDIEDRDTFKSYNDMGRAIRVLNNINHLNIPSYGWVEDALTPNPETLKLTFDQASPELVSRILGNVNERYQFSINFQVRPVLITSERIVRPAYRVGIDSRTQPEVVIGQDGVSISVYCPFKPPIIEKIFPQEFEFINEEINNIEFNVEEKIMIIRGEGLKHPNLFIRIGSTDFEIGRSNDPIRLEWNIRYEDINSLPARTHLLSIVQKEQSVENISRAKAINIIPYITESPVSNQGSDIALVGRFLGRDNDIKRVIFSPEPEGESIEPSPEFTCSSHQRNLIIRISEPTSISCGIYRLFLKINDQDARQAPIIRLIPYIDNVHFDPAIPTEIKLNGIFLGRDQDTITLDFYDVNDQLVDIDTELACTFLQNQLTIKLPEASPLPPGRYRIHIEINDQRPDQFPEVVII
ncbi:MAG: Pvc16 family protein [Candidatus Hodarchaeota archaeon]